MCWIQRANASRFAEIITRYRAFVRDDDWYVGSRNTMIKNGTVFNLSDIPLETRLHEGRMKRYSIRTQGAQIVFGTITPQPPDRQKNHRAPHDHPYDMLLCVLDGCMMQDVE